MPSTESTRTSKSKGCVPVERILDMTSQSAEQAEIVWCVCLRLGLVNLCVMPRVALLRKVMTKREASVIKRLRRVVKMPIQTVAKVTERHKKTIYSVIKGKAKFAKRGPKEKLSWKDVTNLVISCPSDRACHGFNKMRAGTRDVRGLCRNVCPGQHQTANPYRTWGEGSIRQL